MTSHRNKEPGLVPFRDLLINSLLSTLSYMTSFNPKKRSRDEAFIDTSRPQIESKRRHLDMTTDILHFLDSQ